jgi:adenylate cyclase
VKKTLLLIRLRLARLWYVMLAVSAVGTAAGYAWWHFDVLDMSGDELASYDDGLKRFNNQWWFPWGQRSKSKDIVLVAIDDKSFGDISAFGPWRDRYGSWPYDRIIWADVISYLSEAGAKVVVMDFTMSENKADITGDQKLGEAIAKAKMPVITGFNALAQVPALPKVETPTNRIHKPQEAPPPEPEKKEEAGGGEEEFGEFPSEPTPEEAAKAKAEELEKLRAAAAPAFAFPVEFEGGLEPTTFKAAKNVGLPDGGLATAEDVKRDAGLVMVEFPRYPEPAIAQIIEPISGFGAVEVEEDEDGYMRQTHFVYTDGINNYVTLSTAVMADYWGADKLVVSPKQLRFGDHVVRVNPDGSARINYGGTLQSRFDTVPLSDVLRYRAAKPGELVNGEDMHALGVSKFKDKIVFIGAIAQGAGDQKPTPFAALEAGVVKQMTEVDNMLNDAFILEAPEWASILLAFFVALFSVALVMVAQSFITDVGAPIFLTFAFFVITGGFITFTNIHILSAMPGMAGTLAALCATAYNRFLASKDREFLKEAFSSYLDPDVLDQIVEGRKLPPLDGDEREITAFFSDIRGFSTFTEQLKGEPRKLMKLLHDYLSAVTPVLKEHGACIDKYIGDAVVALFGAPHHDPEHPLKACRAALAVQATVAELRREFAKAGLPDVYTRVGLNTDVMLVGNMGSRSRPLNYTAIGDGMNLAARLEGTNKAYETLILIGPKTADAVKGKMVTRELDSIRVAGKTEAIAVYELVGEEGKVAPAKLKVLDLYAKALELYRHRRFADSLRTLKEAYDLDNSDGPTKVLAGKCNQFMQAPPPADWDGVTQLEK